MWTGPDSHAGTSTNDNHRLTRIADAVCNFGQKWSNGRLDPPMDEIWRIVRTQRTPVEHDDDGNRHWWENHGRGTIYSIG